MANDTEISDTPSGLPMALPRYEAEESVATPEVQPTQLQPAAKKQVAVIEVVDCEPAEEEEERDLAGDDELDEIIDRVIEVVKARRAGTTVPPRRRRQGSTQLAANPAPSALAGADTKMNPNKKALVYAGVGVGTVALLGGLWWYFKKKD